MNRLKIATWERCALHQTLVRSDLSCTVCAQEASKGMEPGSLGAIKDDHYEDVEGRRVDKYEDEPNPI